jgi:hypothetical protein
VRERSNSSQGRVLGVCGEVWEGEDDLDQPRRRSGRGKKNGSSTSLPLLFGLGAERVALTR